MVLKLPLATLNFFKVLLKPYDHEIRENAMGLPVLESWMGRDPYTVFERSIERVVPRDIRGALVFLKGRAAGDVQYLQLGQKRLGTGADSHVVIYSETVNERQLIFDVNEEGVEVHCSNADTPFYVNGNKLTSANLVDLDEVQFSGSSFYFIWLRSEL